MSKRLAVLSSIAWFAVAGCDGGASDGWGGTIDTLSNGAVLVSNPATGSWSPAETWTLTEDLRIGALDGGMEAFAQINDLAVDATGRVYVLDRQYQEIRVFDSLGTYVRTIGRQGDGPGEFNLASGMAFDTAGRLWVIDGRNPRYSVFDSGGNYLKSFRREVTRRGYRWVGAFLQSGHLYDYTGVTVGEDRVAALVRYDTSGMFVDTLVLPEYIPDFYEFRSAQGVGMMSVPYATSLHWSIDPTGYVWAGLTDAYRLYRMTMDGDTTRAFERAVTPVSVTSAERDSVLETVREFAGGASFDESRVPDVKPAFQRFAVDDAGFVWVMASVPSATEGTPFDVFDPDGRYLGIVRADVGIGLYVRLLIQGDAMYAVVTDELDVPYVVRLRIGGRPVADPD